MEWQPIETAPRDVRGILAIDINKKIRVVWWNNDEKMFEDERSFIVDGCLTHWMPLPDPPKEG